MVVRLLLTYFETSHSKHFMMAGLNAIGWVSLSQITDNLFGTGMMVIILKGTGTAAWYSEMLKISLRTSPC